MLKFALKHMATRRAKLIMTALSVVITASVALLAYNISTQVSEGIVNTAAKYDIIIGPSGSATQLAMNTMFFTDKPLGTIPYSLVEELQNSGLVNDAIPFSMGDSYNAAPIVGTDAKLLEGKALSSGEMFSEPLEAVVGYAVARQYGLKPGNEIVTSHGLNQGGAAHAEHPLTVKGILKRTDTAYDNAVFTPVSTIWVLHDHEDEHEEGDTHEHEEEEDHEEHVEHDHAHEGQICAVLVRSTGFNAYSQLMNIYSGKSEYLIINPNTVLREVLDNVDLSRKIVYLLCVVILVMNLFVVSVIALLSLYDARKEIALMRLIGISMGSINRLYLIQNTLTGLVAMVLSLSFSHLCLMLIRDFVASMGIVLNAAHIYPMEWAILLVVFLLSVLPTVIATQRMAGKDGMSQL